MIQAIVKKGIVIPEEVPAPKASKGGLLIKVVNSCISAGTEISSVSMTGKSLIRRALDQPDQVKEVLNFIKERGISKTIAKVRGQLDGGKPTGYSISGIVIGIGEGVKEFQIGDEVTAAGMGIANHAEFVDVPVNLVMKMPKGLDFQAASTVTLGGIALQGVRRAELHLGEIAVVIGAGILGLLTQQMLQLSGIRTIVSDIDDHRLQIAKELGAELIINPTKEDPVKAVHNLSGAYGADAIIFTAATGSSEPLSQAFKMCKKKGKVVLVGVSGMEIKRGDMYAKELDFLMSTSYGPGRYDAVYEEKGIDYPYAYVRWTENRNMAEYLRLLQTGSINLTPLIDQTFLIQEVEKAYHSLTNSEIKPLLTFLDYGVDVNLPKQILAASPKRKILLTKKITKQKGKIQVGLIGTGIFASGTHLPNLKKLSAKFQIRAIANRSGHKPTALGNQFGAQYATTDYDEILKDKEIDLVMITTRHDTHADYVIQALEAGKHVFVEKPLAITQEELAKIKAFYDTTTNPPLLMVGFNRRFSKYAKEIKKHTQKRINPLMIQYRMNAGYIPLDHWVHEDGGRIIGECCHLIDLMTYFTESRIVSVSSESLSPKNEKFSQVDNRSIILKYEDGSVCTIQYFATGSKSLSKEYMEVHFDEKSIVLDNYKTLKGYGLSIKNISTSLADKGVLEELTALADSLNSQASSTNWPIEFWDLIQTTNISFQINDL